MWATVATFKASSTGPWRATVSWGTTYTGLSVDVSPQNNYVSLARYWEHPAGVAPDATIGYRSNTGTNGVNSLKIRTLEGSSWSAEMEEATAGSPIREVRSAYSPLADQRIFVTVSDDGWLDAYVCTPTCTVTNNIGQVWSAAPSVVSQRFDIAYEYLSGDALLVYGVLSTNTARDLAYRTYSGGSWGAEQYIDDTGHATDLEYSGVQLVSKKASDQIGLVGRDETDDDTNAWIWDGSAWGNFVEITPTSASGADRISYAIAWESNSGDLIALARDSPTNNVFSREFTTSWSAVSQILCGDSGYLFSLKPNSVDNDMLLVNVHTSGQSLGTCYWTGSAWANGMTHDAAIDGTVTRSADFAWESTGSKGLLVYGTTPGQITYRTFTAPNTWGAVTNVAMGSNAHAWVQLRTNPTPPSGGVKVLGVVLEETANDLGAITWDGSTFTVVGPSTFSADTGTTTFESFELNYRVAPRTNEIQYLVCKDLATSGCDTSTEFTKWDGTAGYDIVASDAESGSYPSLATTWNANADLWVAYAKDVDGTTRAIYARFLDYPSGGWAAAETVDSLASTLFTRPSIGVDRNADVYALYVATSGPQLYYKARTGGSWGSRTAVDTTSDNPTLIVRAPDHAAYASPGGLYWKSSTSETYFYYIPEFETLVLPVILSILVVWGWRRKGRRRTGDAEPESWTEPNGVPPSL